MIACLLVCLALLCGNSLAQNPRRKQANLVSQEDTTLAENNRPVLRFDGKASSFCYPNHPEFNGESYCQTSLNTSAPIFWHVANDGNNKKQICYWHFYAWQQGCFGPFGEHAEDWERICVNFGKSGNNWVAKSYTFYQHNGWYTRCGIEKYQGRPVIYVGKVAHGSYHEYCNGWGFIWQLTYCQGGCGYWDDFRNPGQTWYVSNSNLQYYNQGYGDGFNQPNSPNNAARRAFNNVPCMGSSSRLLTTSGCWQDQIGGSCTMF